jgi:hypothetical protein
VQVVRAGSSPRPVSTGQLSTSRCLHFRPINPVVWLRRSTLSPSHHWSRTPTRSPVARPSRLPQRPRLPGAYAGARIPVSRHSGLP